MQRRESVLRLKLTCANMGDMSDHSTSAQNMARNLRYARMLRHWSQRSLAETANSDSTPINQAMISRLENGTYDPRLSELDAITSALGVTRDMVFQPLDDFAEQYLQIVAPEELRRSIDDLVHAAHTFEKRRVEVRAALGEDVERTEENVLTVQMADAISSASVHQILELPGPPVILSDYERFLEGL